MQTLPGGRLNAFCNSAHTDATSDNRFCLYMENGVAKLKKDHEYYDQVQGQMAITRTKWCDFVVYTSLGLNIDRVYFDAEHWKKLRQNYSLYILDIFYLLQLRKNNKF